MRPVSQEGQDDGAAGDKRGAGQDHKGDDRSRVAPSRSRPALGDPRCRVPGAGAGGESHRHELDLRLQAAGAEARDRPALAAPRCGAKTRAEKPCQSPAMANGRCRMHGGASTGPRTAEGLARIAKARTRTGMHTREWVRLRRLLAELACAERDACRRE